jgi:hypothetical protein
MQRTVAIVCVAAVLLVAGVPQGHPNSAFVIVLAAFVVVGMFFIAGSRRR